MIRPHPPALRDLTTGEADAWQAGAAWGQQQGMADIASLQATIRRLQAQVAALKADADSAPTGLEARGG